MHHDLNLWQSIQKSPGWNGESSPLASTSLQALLWLMVSCSSLKTATGKSPLTNLLQMEKALPSSIRFKRLQPPSWVLKSVHKDTFTTLTMPKTKWYESTLTRTMMAMGLATKLTIVQPYQMHCSSTATGMHTVTHATMMTITMAFLTSTMIVPSGTPIGLLQSRPTMTGTVAMMLLRTKMTITMGSTIKLTCADSAPSDGNPPHLPIMTEMDARMLVKTLTMTTTASVMQVTWMMYGRAPFRLRRLISVQ